MLTVALAYLGRPFDVIPSLQAPMTDLELIAQNFEAITQSTDNLAAVFYGRFFGRHPELREFFSPSLAAQQQMLNETITSVIEHLEDARWVRSNMESLGIRHQSYEVTDEMYDFWTEALVGTLRALSGDGWSDRLERVWREQLGLICGFARNASVGGT
jgi:hemoglobin-like flavoprotein